MVNAGTNVSVRCFDCGKGTLTLGTKSCMTQLHQKVKVANDQKFATFSDRLTISLRKVVTIFAGQTCKANEMFGTRFALHASQKKIFF